MKKFLSFVCSIIMMTSLVSANAMAEPNDEYSYLIIADAEGNIVYEETISLYTTYVDGSLYTIPAGGTLTTYKYYPSAYFSTGFKISETTANRDIKIELFKSASIGGTRTKVTEKTVNTSTSATIGPDNNTYMVSTNSIDSSKPYYNGKITNMSSSSMILALCVVMD